MCLISTQSSISCILHKPIGQTIFLQCASNWMRRIVCKQSLIAYASLHSRLQNANALNPLMMRFAVIWLNWNSIPWLQWFLYIFLGTQSTLATHSHICNSHLPYVRVKFYGDVKKFSQHNSNGGVYCYYNGSTVECYFRWNFITRPNLVTIKCTEQRPRKAFVRSCDGCYEMRINKLTLSLLRFMTKIIYHVCPQDQHKWGVEEIRMNDNIIRLFKIKKNSLYSQNLYIDTFNLYVVGISILTNMFYISILNKPKTVEKQSYFLL